LRLAYAHSSLDHIDPWDVQLGYDASEQFKREKLDYLRSVADRIARNDLLSVETMLLDGTDVEKSLLTGVVGVDLVVIASRRKGLLRRLFSRSLADGLRRHLRTPALFVHGHSFPVDLTGDPIARHILVPLNGSVLAERILSPVTELGRLETTMTTLLNVQHLEWKLGVFEHTTPPGYLLGIAQTLKAKLPFVEAQVLTTERSIPAAISTYAMERRVDLIALATRSGGWLPEFLRHGVADSLIRNSSVPILLLNVDQNDKRPEITTVVD
jgi:nucleotide-binding universal stress UspA family protein